MHTKGCRAIIGIIFKRYLLLMRKEQHGIINSAKQILRCSQEYARRMSTHACWLLLGHVKMGMHYGVLCLVFEP